MPALLYPVFVQTALTFALLIWMGVRRTAAIRRGEVSLMEVALNAEVYDEKTRAVGNSYRNQFQLPVLFYVLVALSLATGEGETALVGLAWVFVLMRIAHAYVHVTTNFVPRRFGLFLTSMVALLAMWVVYALCFIFADTAIGAGA